MAKASGTIDLKGMKKASQQATNYMSTDSSGVMVADMTGGIQTPSTITDGKNILITSNDIKIRDGQQQLASYGQNITVGRTDGINSNVDINSGGVDIKSGSTVVSHFGNTVRIGKSTSENIVIGSSVVRVNAIDGTNALKITFEPRKVYDIDGQLIGKKYGAQITNEDGYSTINILPASDGNTFLNTMDYYSSMESIVLESNSDIQLDVGDEFVVNGNTEMYGNTLVSGDVTINGLCLSQSALTFSSKNDFKAKIYGGANQKCNVLVPYLFIGETEWSRSALGSTSLNGTSWGIVFCYSTNNVHALFMYGGNLYKTVWNGSTFSTQQFAFAS